MSTLSARLSFNESLDIEGRLFSACFVKTLHKNGTKVFTSREIQEVAQCTFDALEKIYKQSNKK